MEAVLIYKVWFPLKFFKIMLRARKAARRAWFCRTEIAMHRALQFLVSRGTPYHCTAGDTLITVQPDGDLYPCRRIVGNVLETPLCELYHRSDLFCSLRDHNRIDPACRDVCM